MVKHFLWLWLVVPFAYTAPASAQASGPSKKAEASTPALTVAQLPPVAFVASKIVVGDLEASARFYSSVFQLKESHRGDGNVAGRTYSEVVYDPTHPGGAVLVLRRYHDKPRPSLDEAVVAFVAKDLASTLKRVESAGGKVVQQPIALPKHRNLNSYVTDPEGHLVEIVQLY